MPDRRTILLKGVRREDPVISYGQEDGRNRQLVITRIGVNSIAGYLLLSGNQADAFTFELPRVAPVLQRHQFSGERCRFSDCTHKEEPGCAIREAGGPRYAAWLRLLEL